MHNPENTYDFRDPAYIARIDARPLPDGSVQQAPVLVLVATGEATTGEYAAVRREDAITMGRTLLWAAGVPEMREVVAIARAMRAAQKLYFADRTKGALRASLDWERKLDAALEALAQADETEGEGNVCGDEGPDGPPAPVSPRSLFMEIAAWGAAQFPGGRAEGAYTHLQREVIEIGQAMRYYAPPAVAEECADALHLLIQLGRLCGFDLLAATREKFEANKLREWGKPDAAGVTEHVREGTVGA